MKTEKQETEQEQRIREALERFVQQTTRAHGLVDDRLGGENLWESHERKARSNLPDDPSFWDEQKNREQGLTILLIRRRPTGAEEIGSNRGGLMLESPLTLRGTHEELAWAVRLYNSTSNLDRTVLKQKIWRLTMGSDRSGSSELTPDFVGFIIYIWGQPPVAVSVPTQN